MGPLNLLNFVTLLKHVFKLTLHYITRYYYYYYYYYYLLLLLLFIIQDLNTESVTDPLQRV